MLIKTISRGFDRVEKLPLTLLRTKSYSDSFPELIDRRGTLEMMMLDFQLDTAAAQGVPKIWSPPPGPTG